MKTSLLLIVLATMAPRSALGHATEIRHCITIDGMLRIFIQHWHGESAPGDKDTMDLRANHDGGQVFTKRPTGHVNNVPDITTGLPGCEFTISDAVTKCENQNHDDWVWYDFQAEIGVQISYTLLVGNSVMLMEGCEELLPATITGVLTMPTPEEIQKQKDFAWEKTYTKTVDFWNDPDARLKAKALDMRTFLLDPFDLNFPEKVSNGRWVKDTSDKNWNLRQGRMAEATGRLLFTFGSTTASCSGTAVRDYASPDRSLIVTAAHCIYEEKTKVFADNIIFIPNQDDGSDGGISNRNCDDDPYGCWVPEFAVVDSEWASNINDVTHDFGFLVVKNKGAHAGPGGRDLALEDVVRAIDIDWTDKAELAAGDLVFNMGLPGSWSNQLKYARGKLRLEKNLQFVEGCELQEGASGGPMPANPLDDNPRLFSVNSFKSGYFDDDGEFIQTSCGGPILTGNSYCKLLEVAESLEFGSPEAVTDGGIIVPYENTGCNMPGWCDTDAECDNGIFCDGVEQCIQNACVSSGDPCDGFRCSEEDSVCLDPCTDDSQCDDGIFCNGAEACFDGKCLPGLGNPCASGEMCEPFQDKCMAAECTTNLDCDDGVFCNGKEMCIEGQCQPGYLPCDADEDCYEVSGECANQVCTILDDEIMCQDDDVNDCCVCLEWCGPQDASLVECGSFLFFPRPIEYGFEKTDEWGHYTPEYLEYLESANMEGNSTSNSTLSRRLSGDANSTLSLDSNSTGLVGNWEEEEEALHRVPAFPTCLMWTLFMDGKAPTRFTEV